MISSWTLAILLVSVTSREVWTSLCYSRNCFMTISDQTTENLTCTVGFENEFQNFKKKYGFLGKYDHPLTGLIQERPKLLLLKLLDYSKTPNQEINKYNSKGLEHVTHGLMINVRVPESRESRRVLYLELSSKNPHGDKDEFYDRFPKKRIFNFSTTHAVTIENHLCLQDIKHWPVSYTLLLTLYQPHMSPMSIEHLLSFSKDNIVVAVSKFPKKNDIHVVFYAPQFMCVKRMFLCNDTDYKTCEKFIRKCPEKLDMMSHTNVCTFFDILPGVYYIKVEMNCPSMDMDEGSFFAESYSPMLEVLGSPGKDVMIMHNKSQEETSNTPFIIIGCLIALILLIVMYIAVKKNVSPILERRRKKSQPEEMNLFHHSADRSTDGSTQSRTHSPEILLESINQVSEDNMHIAEENDLKRDFCKINRIKRNEKACPVHGYRP